LKTERVAGAFRLAFLTPLAVRNLSKTAHIYKLIVMESAAIKLIIRWIGASRLDGDQQAKVEPRLERAEIAGSREASNTSVFAPIERQVIDLFGWFKIFPTRELVFMSFYLI
jgi:hypothetical protein